LTSLFIGGDIKSGSKSLGFCGFVRKLMIRPKIMTNQAIEKKLSHVNSARSLFYVLLIPV